MERTGAISLANDSDIYVADQIGIGTTTPGDLTLKVGAGASMLAVDGDGVGIGSTANQFISVLLDILSLVDQL